MNTEKHITKKVYIIFGAYNTHNMRATTDKEKALIIQKQIEENMLKGGAMDTRVYINEIELE